MLDAGRVSLRERKKARTRAALREHALRLFREQGYQATTVEQIAAAAEVSPSTFFRYFPTKEDVVLQDDMDTRMIAALEQQPAGLGPVAAIRAAVRQMSSSYTAADLDVLRETTALTMTVPEIRARALDEFARAIGGIAEAVAKRAGRAPTTWPSAPRPARSSGWSCRSPCRGRAGPRRPTSRTCSSASTRRSPCWKRACRCEAGPPLWAAVGWIVDQSGIRGGPAAGHTRTWSGGGAGAVLARGGTSATDRDRGGVRAADRAARVSRRSRRWPGA